MNSRVLTTLIAISSLGALPALLAGCSPSRAQNVTVEAPLAEVEVVSLRDVHAPVSVEIPGAVSAVRSVTLTASVGGVVRTIVEEGKRVPANGILASLASPGLPEAVSAAQAAIAASEYRQSSARAAASQAERDQQATIASLTQSLVAATAERDRRKSVLAETQLQVETEPARLRAQLRGAEAHLRQLQSGEREQRIVQLEALLKVAQLERQTAEKERNRQKELYAQGFVSRGELELAQLNLQRAQANEVNHTEELRLARTGAHPETIEESSQQVEVARLAVRAAQSFPEQLSQRKAELVAADAEVTRATQALAEAKRNQLSITRADADARAMAADTRRSELGYLEARERLAQATLRAPFAGQVVRRQVQPGENVTVGEQLV